jgi:hypothetical protein
MIAAWNSGDYVIGGEIRRAESGMGVIAGPVFGDGPSYSYPVYSDHDSVVIPVSPASGNDRIDILEARGTIETYDPKRRAFFNPELETGQYFTVDTKKRLVIEFTVKAGDPGSVSAPDTDEGYIKLAEIHVRDGAASLEDDDIKGVTARIPGEANTGWTNETARTFALRTLRELQTMFLVGHNENGQHRDAVIKAANIDFGTGNNQVRGTIIPLGQGFYIDADEFLADDSLRDALLKEGLARKAAIADATTAENILVKLKTVDGAGSGLDADLLAGHPPEYYLGLAADTIVAVKEIAGPESIISYTGLGMTYNQEKKYAVFVSPNGIFPEIFLSAAALEDGIHVYAKMLREGSLIPGIRMKKWGTQKWGAGGVWIEGVKWGVRKWGVGKYSAGKLQGGDPWGNYASMNINLLIKEA